MQGKSKLKRRKKLNMKVKTQKIREKTLGWNEALNMKVHTTKNIRAEIEDSDRRNTVGIGAEIVGGLAGRESEAG